MHRYRRFMVGLTGTDSDAGLIRYASMVARLGTAEEVRFVHVLPSEEETKGGNDHGRVQAELQAAVAQEFTAVPQTVRIAFDILSGPLVDQLLTCAAEHEVDLLFVGHRRQHPMRWALARRLAMKAPCSVWLVPEGFPAFLERILVPIDFSEPAADAMRVAASMAHLNGHAECLTLHVYFNEARTTFEAYGQVLQGEEVQAFHHFLEPINCHGIAIKPLFEESASVAHAIGRVAQNHGVDLVVMATRGRSRSAAVLLGSVTEETIIDTKIPLLVVKHFGARLGVLQVLLDRKFRHQGRIQTD